MSVNGFGKINASASLLASASLAALASASTSSTSVSSSLTSRLDTDTKDESKALDQRIEESQDLEKDSKQQTYSAQAKSDPSAKDLGLSEGDIDDHSKVEQVIAETQAANFSSGDSDGITTYSSHPIQQLIVGPYHFQNSLLKLESHQVADFEKLWKLLPLPEQMRISKLNMDRVAEIVESRQQASQQFDSSVGRSALEDLMKANPRVGTQPIGAPQQKTGHAAPSQTDGNVEYRAEDIVDTNAPGSNM